MFELRLWKALFLRKGLEITFCDVREISDCSKNAFVIYLFNCCLFESFWWKALLEKALHFFWKKTKKRTLEIGFCIFRIAFLKDAHFDTEVRQSSNLFYVCMLFQVLSRGSGFLLIHLISRILVWGFFLFRMLVKRLLTNASPKRAFYKFCFRISVYLKLLIKYGSAFGASRCTLKVLIIPSNC